MVREHTMYNSNPAKFIETYLIFFYVFYYLFLTERDRARAGVGQRERETQNPKQAPGSELSAQSPTRGLNPRTVRSWPELKLDMLNQLSHLGAPILSIFNKTHWSREILHKGTKLYFVLVFSLPSMLFILLVNEPAMEPTKYLLNAALCVLS